AASFDKIGAISEMGSLVLLQGEPIEVTDFWRVSAKGASLLTLLGVKVNLDAKPQAQHFPLIKNKTTEFYMLGWGVPTFDSHYIFNFLVHETTENRGSWNNTGYANADVNAKIVALESETDLDKRNGIIGEIWAQVQEDQLYLPIHNQVLNWGMKNGIQFDVQPEDQPHFKYLVMN
ncbi:MAG: hypothetical protein VXW25_04885, partial [Pseudomonadota bacterium]|nr:hypothetical protein [Pseudomonadota bacterium]